MRSWPGIPADGLYGGNSWRDGHKAAAGRCLASVWRANYWQHGQCSRKAVIDGLCKQHHAEKVRWESPS